MIYTMAIMTRPATIGHLLALLAVVGLMLAPLVRPAMARGMADYAMPTAAVMTHAGMARAGLTDTGMADTGMADADMADVMDAMPCCPHNTRVPDCGYDCRFMALCSAMPFGVPLASLTTPLAEAGVVLPGDQSDLVSVTRSPPRRPPKHPGSAV
jgi:hypothetical protein